MTCCENHLINPPLSHYRTANLGINFAILGRHLHNLKRSHWFYVLNTHTFSAPLECHVLYLLTKLELILHSKSEIPVLGSSMPVSGVKLKRG